MQKQHRETLGGGGGPLGPRASERKKETSSPEAGLENPPAQNKPADARAWTFDELKHWRLRGRNYLERTGTENETRIQCWTQKDGAKHRILVPGETVCSSDAGSCGRH